MEFFHKNEYVRSYSIYKHDTTLKMTFGAIFFLDDFNSGPPSSGGGGGEGEGKGGGGRGQGRGGGRGGRCGGGGGGKGVVARHHLPKT